MQNTIYYGDVIHHRVKPIEHCFKYKVAMPCCDVENLDAIKFPLFMRIVRKNYLPKYSGTLYQAIQALIKEKTGADWVGKSYFIGYPSFWGYCYNPVVFFYCFNLSGKLEYIIAEIHNTPWGERHQYVIPCDNNEKNDCHFDKKFHISPFFPMDLHYHWTFEQSKGDLKVLMKLSLKDEKMFYVKFNLSCDINKEPNPKRYFLSSPFRTHLTHFRIYIQALFLYLKKTPFFSHPKYL